MKHNTVVEDRERDPWTRTLAAKGTHILLRDEMNLIVVGEQTTKTKRDTEPTFSSIIIRTEHPYIIYWNPKWPTSIAGGGLCPSLNCFKRRPCIRTKCPPQPANPPTWMVTNNDQTPLVLNLIFEAFYCVVFPNFVCNINA